MSAVGDVPVPGRVSLRDSDPEHDVGSDSLSGSPPEYQPLHPQGAYYQKHDAAESDARVSLVLLAPSKGALRHRQVGQEREGVFLGVLVAGYYAQEVALLEYQSLSAAVGTQVFAVEVLQL